MAAMRLCSRLTVFVLMVLLAASVAAKGASPQEALPQEEKRAVRLQGDARTVFAQLGELFSVRVVVDEELPPRPVRLRLAEADFTTALRLAAELASAFWVEFDDGTVLVAANTPDKHRQYDRQVVHTFSLAGSKPEELAERVRLLREIFEMRQIQADPRTNTFTVQDTPERLALAAQMLEQLRREPGQVLVEALLLEVDRERARRLGLLPPQQITVIHLGSQFLDLARTEKLIDIIRPLLERGLIPETFLGVSVQTLLALLAADPSLLESALPPFILFGGGATPFVANLPGATLNLLELASVARSMRRVSLRARHGEEATLFVGERVPVVTATFIPFPFPEIPGVPKPGEGAPAIPGLTYEEVGLKLAARPQLHEAGEVSLRIKLALRAVTGANLNDIPVFSNRVLEQTARLKAGEAMLLSGLLSETPEKVRQGMPGLGRLPGLGYLFSRRETRVRETELLVLLTARIVRVPEPEPAAVRPLYVGTQARFSPLGPPPAAPAVPPQPQGSALPPQPSQKTRTFRIG